ncbi:MAG: radical SAM protein [Candidatus Aenigmatarchaeota archaeon]
MQKSDLKKFEKEIYFNINYRSTCNNNCLFCDADEGYELITSQKIFEILEKERVGPKDRVVYCGGEPTTHPEIIDIVQGTCKKYSSNLYFLTNGRKLSDLEFSKKLLKKIKGGCVSVPIYGYTSSMHDYLTQSNGSFKETIKGVTNLFKLRDDYGFDFEIELKVLICKPTYKYISKIVKFIQKKFPQPDYLVISSLDISNRVLENLDKVFVRLSEASPYLREAIDMIDDKENLVLYFIPLCILKDEKYFPIANSLRGILCKAPTKYYDPRNLNGIVGYTEKSKSPNCKLCKYDNFCDGLWKRYTNLVGFGELVPF